MPARRRPARPVEIVLTEEDLAAIIEETVRPGGPGSRRPGLSRSGSGRTVSGRPGAGRRGPGRSDGGKGRGSPGEQAAGAWSGPGEDGPGGVGEGQGPGVEAASRGGPEEPYSPVADSVWNRGVPRPGAVGDAIRRILEATNLDPGRPTRRDGSTGDDEEE